MESYIQIETRPVPEDYNPTPQQRAVYRFHDQRQTDEAGDIYSSEWFDRTRSFLEQYASHYELPTTLNSWEMVQTLDFGAFFLAHPVAGYSLWIFVRACADLDWVVCRTPAAEFDKISVRPFVYLQSKKVHAKWEKSLRILKSEILKGVLDGDELIQRVYDIMRGVERLKHSCSMLGETFGENLKGMRFADKMVDEAVNAVNDRCQMIESLLRVDSGWRTLTDETSSKATDSSFHFPTNVSKGTSSNGQKRQNPQKAVPLLSGIQLKLWMSSARRAKERTVEVSHLEG
jgi:hypothetical protein